jgi:ATP-binding cassette subfamily F protein 1
LARALYLEPELLLLDEPTNHLDLEATIWLSDYLGDWKKTVIIVSHNIGFLNEVCDYMLNIEDKKIVEYKGNYYLFKKQFHSMQEKKEKEWKDYEKKIKDLQKKKNDKKKVDEFIEKNKVSRPEKPYDVTINFGNPALIRSNIIDFSDVTFGYSPDKILLDNISLGLDMKSKVALVGANGCGKSTIVKLITKELDVLSGSVNINSQSKIGYYNQHFESQLPIDKTPIEYLLELIPDEYIKNGIKEQTVREYLGSVKLEPSAHNKKIGELSGGQKARVAFTKIIFQKPHFLVLDEPTNHLDIETVDALIDGLVKFEGGIIVITHDSELIERLGCEIWMLSSMKINYKIESFDNYRELSTSHS